MSQRCHYCNEPLEENKKYCSKVCRKKHYKKGPDRDGKIVRALLIGMLGGKCALCGYSKNGSALEFHHIRDKGFDLHRRLLQTKPWKEIIEEVEKCVLLCSNCHTELHRPHLNIAVQL